MSPTDKKFYAQLTAWAVFTAAMLLYAVFH